MQWVALLATIAVVLPTGSVRSAGAGGSACANGQWDRRELAHGKFLGRRWELGFYRDGQGRRCLADEWGRYASLFRFRVDEDRPRLGMLNLAATSSPNVRRTVYVMDGYVGPRIERLTFRLDGKADRVDVVRTPGWTRSKSNLFIHLVGRGRFDRDRTGVLRAFDHQGRVVARRTLREGDFYRLVEVD